MQTVGWEAIRAYFSRSESLGSVETLAKMQQEASTRGHGRPFHDFASCSSFFFETSTRGHRMTCQVVFWVEGPLASCVAKAVGCTIGIVLARIVHCSRPHQGLVL